MKPSAGIAASGAAFHQSKLIVLSITFVDGAVKDRLGKYAHTRPFPFPTNAVGLTNTLT